jgi:hypothetical protein
VSDTGGGGGGLGNFFEKLLDGITNNLSNIGNAAVNFYGEKEAAEAYERAAGKDLKWQKNVFRKIDDWLEPYRTMAEGKTGEISTAASADLALGEDAPMAEVWDGFENLPGLKGSSNLKRSTDPRSGLSDILATTGQWGDANLITEGSDAYNLLTDDAVERAKNWAGARGKYNTQEAQDAAQKSLLRSVGEIEGINQSRLTQEMARRGMDYDMSSGKRGQLFGEGFDLGTRDFRESLAANEFDRMLKSGKRAQLAGEQEGEARTKFDMNTALRGQLWNEMMGEDAQEFEKLLKLWTTGENAAAQTGVTSTNLSRQISEVFQGLGANDSSSTANQWAQGGDLLSSILSGYGKRTNGKPTNSEIEDIFKLKTYS